MKSKNALPELPGADLVGYGFNIFGDFSPDSKTYLVLDKGQPSEYVYGGVDYMSFANLTVTNIGKVIVRQETFSSKSEIQKSLAIQAGISFKTDTFLAGTFDTEINAKYDHISNSEEENYYVMSSTHNELYSITGGLPNVLSHPDIKDLPDEFDSQNAEIFFRVLQKYGAYYIKEARVGASLTYYEAISKAHGFDKESASANAKFEYESVFTKTKASASVDWSKVTESWKTYRKSYSQVIGGTVTGDLVVTSPSGSIDDINRFQAYNEWLKSVEGGNGVVVSFSVAPLYDLLQGKKAIALQQATAAFLNNKFSIKADSRKPSIFANGFSLIPQNSFPTLPNINCPSVWIVIMERHTRKIELNLLFPLMRSTVKEFPATPDVLDQQDFQKRIYLALSKYQGNKDYIILMVTYDLGVYATGIVSEPQNLELINFLSISGAGSAFEKWKNIFVSSYPLNGGYVLTGIIGEGPNQGKDRISFPLCIESGAFIPSLDTDKVAFTPVVTSFEDKNIYTTSETSIENSKVIFRELSTGLNFKIKLDAATEDKTKIFFNDKSLTPQNGFPIFPAGEMYNGIWIIIVDMKTGDLVFNVIFDSSEPMDLDRIYNALSIYNTEAGRYMIGFVSTSGNNREVFYRPFQTKLGDFLLESGASENALKQWYYDSQHSGMSQSGCNYALIGVIGNGPNQGMEVYRGIKALPEQPTDAIVNYPS